MVLLHHEHVTIVCLSEHKATKKYRKNLPKTIPKRGPNPLKIDAKNVLFFNIVFFGFRPRFWRVLGLQLGAKLALKASKNFASERPNDAGQVGGKVFATQKGLQASFATSKTSENRARTLQNRARGPPKSSPEPSKTQFLKTSNLRG